MNVGENDAVDPGGTPETPRPEGAESPRQEQQPQTGAPAENPELVALREAAAAAKREFEQSQARLRAVSKAYTELQAEMKSFKERMEQRAKQDSELLAYDQVRAFFDPVMNLKRSLATSSNDLPSLLQGLQMVQTQFMDALGKLGLAEVQGVGSNFDPSVHEALAVQPVSDKEQDGKVLAVHTTGYTVNGRVLQAAQVVIGKYTEVSGEA
jgi:molecular chaperone GrpE